MNTSDGKKMSAPCEKKPCRPGAPTDGKGMFAPCSDGKGDKEKAAAAPTVTGIPKDGPNMAGEVR